MIDEARDQSFQTILERVIKVPIRDENFDKICLC